MTMIDSLIYLVSNCGMFSLCLGDFGVIQRGALGYPCTIISDAATSADFHVALLFESFIFASYSRHSGIEFLSTCATRHLSRSRRSSVRITGGLYITVGSTGRSSWNSASLPPRFNV